MAVIKIVIILIVRLICFSDNQTLVSNNAAMPVIVKSQSADGEMSAAITTWTTPTVISPMTMANPYDNKNERGKAFRQILAAVVANLGEKMKTHLFTSLFCFLNYLFFVSFCLSGTINTGLVFGFSAVLLPQLADENSDIKITQDEKSWIGKCRKHYMIFKEFTLIMM